MSDAEQPLEQPQEGTPPAGPGPDEEVVGRIRALLDDAELRAAKRHKDLADAVARADAQAALRHKAAMQKLEEANGAQVDVLAAVESLQQAVDKLAAEVRGDEPGEDGKPSFNDEMEEVKATIAKIIEKVEGVPALTKDELEPELRKIPAHIVEEFGKDAKKEGAAEAAV